MLLFRYFVSVLTTIEKLFQIQSKTTGIIMSATEMGQIGGALLLTYYGGQGHRPKWIGWGMVLFGASAALCSLPHFLFGWTAPNSVSSSNPMAADTNQSHLIVTKQMDMTCHRVNYSSPSYLNLTDIDDRNQKCAGRSFLTLRNEK